MSEDRIIELLLLAGDQTTDLLQWWLSISIGVVALAHFVARKLNLTIVIVVSVLYAAHTYSTVDGILRLGRVSSGGLLDLERMADLGNVSLMTETFLQPAGLPPPGLAYAVAFVGTFLGTLGFLVYSYSRARSTKGN